MEKQRSIAKNAGKMGGFNSRPLFNRKRYQNRKRKTEIKDEKLASDFPAAISISPKMFRESSGWGSSINVRKNALEKFVQDQSVRPNPRDPIHAIKAIAP